MRLVVDLHSPDVSLRNGVLPYALTRAVIGFRKLWSATTRASLHSRLPFESSPGHSWFIKRSECTVRSNLRYTAHPSSPPSTPTNPLLPASAHATRYVASIRGSRRQYDRITISDPWQHERTVIRVVKCGGACGRWEVWRENHSRPSSRPRQAGRTSRNHGSLASASAM